MQALIISGNVHQFTTILLLFPECVTYVLFILRIVTSLNLLPLTIMRNTNSWQSRFGGTNAHAVLERAPFLKKTDADIDDSQEFQSRKLFVLSANDKNAVEAMMKNMGIYLEQRPEIFQSDLMGNVAYTLGQRRSFFQWRVAISSPTSFELIEMLNSGKISPTRDTETPRIGFIFTGQGAQWNAMGRELYEQYPVFAASMEACDKCLSSFGATFSVIGEFE